MTHLTPETIRDWHYLPANNLTAIFLTCGWEEALTIIKQKVADIRARTDFCPICRDAVADWYEKSMFFQLDRKRIGTDYPPFVMPEHR